MGLEVLEKEAPAQLVLPGIGVADPGEQVGQVLGIVLLARKGGHAVQVRLPALQQRQELRLQPVRKGTAQPCAVGWELFHATCCRQAVAYAHGSAGGRGQGPHRGSRTSGPCWRVHHDAEPETWPPATGQVPSGDLMRFFQNLDQDTIAAKVGYSQMHISRLQRRALARMRAQLVES